VTTLPIQDLPSSILPNIAYLDTNVVLWIVQSKLERFSDNVLDVLNNAALLLSPMVLIELEYLYEIGRSRISSREVQIKIEYELGTRVCDLPFPAVANVMIGEKWTRDPFDRMIVAQAKANGFAHLVSADQEIAKHYLRTIW
jgi:PIN domain nuclease of toxin-antitoxin system